MSTRVLGAFLVLVVMAVGAVLVVRGLVDAAPLVNWATEEEQARTASGARLVRAGCALTGLAGVGLLLTGSWWGGGGVVLGSLALAVVVGSSTLWSLVLGLGLVAFGVGAGIGLLVRAARSTAAG